MKRAAILGVFLATFAISSAADAGLFSRNNSSNVRYIRRQDGTYVEQRTRRPNAFQRMWELEKKKNAWLKRTFLGG